MTKKSEKAREAEIADQPNRGALPIPHREHTGLITYDAKDPDTSFPPIEPLLPPEGAPNVLIILLDDAGFGSASVFGGPCDTPVAERLAAKGLRYNRFHTTALCAPTRQALLTGRNHHSVGMGAIPEIATSAPGYSSVRPNTAAPLAETLTLNGFSTAHFGKCHEVPVWETSPMGPYDAWPSKGGGFEHFFGFLGGETNQYAPALYSGTTPIEPDKTPEEGYHFTEDITDRAIAWVREQKALMPDKPFFMYFAPGATHAPHHVPEEWSAKYKGKFDQGWDKLREEILARQKKLGVVPEDAELTPRHEEIPAWDDMPDEMKPILARQMEIYAGFMEHTDHHVGRLLDAVEDLEILDDTLVYYIVGDNGASGEGTLNGSFNELLYMNGASQLETPEFMAERIDKFGTPEAYNHYAVGWAHAMDTPYQWTKQVASHWGGTRNGTIIHWPNGIKAKGEIRPQFHHVIDIAPTILEAARVPEPTSVNGVQQMPLQGTSMVYSFDDSAAAERRETQYFEMFVNRGIYHKGWTAVTRHSTPWETGGELPPYDDDVWELYGPHDWSQTKDLSKENPDKLHELQRLFLIEATRYGVLPLDDRRVERFDPGIAGRPLLIHGKSQLLFGGMSRLTENTVINIKNKSHSVTAQIEVPKDGAEGVIVAQGGAFGGWSLYLKDGKPTYCYNLAGLMQVKVGGEKDVPAGEHQVRVEFGYDGGGLGKGGDLTLYLDGKEAGKGRIEASVPLIFSGDETTDVGSDGGTPVSDDYRVMDNEFTGRVDWVQIDIDDAAENSDHLITAEQRWRVAMARQ
ncbi:MAG TPA: arylsulfatase [Solirubrobacterales bacterium]|nr:arylsulfatase [Solirubrobacterales bacterium]